MIRMSCLADPVGRIWVDWGGQETGHNIGTSYNIAGRSGETDRRELAPRRSLLRSHRRHIDRRNE
jgi:hypothetical protein